MTDRALRAAPDPDDFSDLYEKIARSAPSPSGGGPWDPQGEGPGSEIKGRVVGVREINSEWGKRPIITLATEEGEREVCVFHAMLRSLLEEQPPARGARILIRYEGTGTTAKGYEFHRYSVAVDHTLDIPSGASWVDAFNGISTPSRPGTQSAPTRGPASPPADASDLPF